MSKETDQVLPAPRLELRWVELDENEADGRGGWECVYSLVLPLSKGDIRREGEDVDEFSLEISTTVSRGRPHPVHDGVVDAPYRDGEHIKLDCESLGGHISMFAICGDVVTDLGRSRQAVDI